LVAAQKEVLKATSTPSNTLSYHAPCKNSVLCYAISIQKFISPITSYKKIYESTTIDIQSKVSGEQKVCSLFEEVVPRRATKKKLHKI